MQHLNPFDDPQLDCHVLQNAQQQYSLWPAFKALPLGWQTVFGPQPQAICLSWLNENWRDIRPVTENTNRSDNV
ncbi:MbtH family protein [Mixta mediterraneensis]|uniref:MbtH family protein n=1 Tax=Mixta mediterraneensis TaxID=2758443 RepID=UPI001876EC51|nr:MbtH family protein [Mixta mediterraneensis]MBE5252720.1 MbtH family protein [Mixta mediterraneensis]